MEHSSLEANICSAGRELFPRPFYGTEHL